jgi:hypothetical protein
LVTAKMTDPTHTSGICIRAHSHTIHKIAFQKGTEEQSYRIRSASSAIKIICIAYRFLMKISSSTLPVNG